MKCNKICPELFTYMIFTKFYLPSNNFVQSNLLSSIEHYHTDSHSWWSQCSYTSVLTSVMGNKVPNKVDSNQDGYFLTTLLVRTDNTPDVVAYTYNFSTWEVETEKFGMIVMTAAILRSTEATVRPYLNKTKTSNNKTRTDDPDKIIPAVADYCLGFLLHPTCPSPLLNSETPTPHPSICRERRSLKQPL